MIACPTRVAIHGGDAPSKVFVVRSTTVDSVPVASTFVTVTTIAISMISTTSTTSVAVIHCDGPEEL